MRRSSGNRLVRGVSEASRDVRFAFLADELAPELCQSFGPAAEHAAGAVLRQHNAIAVHVDLQIVLRLYTALSAQ